MPLDRGPPAKHVGFGLGVVCRRRADLMGQRDKNERPISGRSCRPAIDPERTFGNAL
jgi:hypothetical protein